MASFLGVFPHLFR